MGKSLNTYQSSDGQRWRQDQIDRKTRVAKRMKLEQQRFEHSYNFCEECGKNENAGEPLDCSHDVSVKEAKESGQTELAWTIDNITIRCRSCHSKYDKNHVQLNWKN